MQRRFDESDQFLQPLLVLRAGEQRRKSIANEWHLLLRGAADQNSASLYYTVVRF